MMTEKILPTNIACVCDDCCDSSYADGDCFHSYILSTADCNRLLLNFPGIHTSHEQLLSQVCSSAQSCRWHPILIACQALVPSAALQRTDLGSQETCNDSKTATKIYNTAMLMRCGAKINKYTGVTANLTTSPWTARGVCSENDNINVMLIIR